MRFIILIFFLVLSCKPVDVKNQQPTKVEKDSSYVVIPNATKTLKLHFKKEEKISDPVTRITYFVTDYNTENVRKKTETIAAEKIYWKSDKVLAIIPYAEVMKEQTGVSVANEKNEILITIK